MVKWLFRMMVMMVIGGAVVFTAQFRNGRQLEGKALVHAEKTDSKGSENLEENKESVREELLDMYFQALYQLVQSDPGLGEDVACFGFDFSQAGSLTQKEKEILAERLKKRFHKTKILFATLEELERAGHIKKDEGLYWEDGMLLTLAVTKEEKNSVVFSISAWRSGLGAIGQDDCEAKRGTKGKWKMEEGKPVNCWVS